MNDAIDDLAIAVAALRLDLCCAAAIFEEFPDIEDKHASVEMTLRAIGQFLNAIGLSDRAVAPFHALAGALIDASNGKRNALIEPRKLGVKQPLPIAHQAIRGEVAAIVTLCMENVGDLEPAAKAVARKLVKAGICIPTDIRAAEPWSVIKRWREHAMDKHSHDMDAERYRKMLAAVEKFGLPPRQAADRLLAALVSNPFLKI